MTLPTKLPAQLVSPILFDVQCCHCEHTTDIYVELRDLIRWATTDDRENKCFPYLTERERNIIRTKTCGLCWDVMFRSLPDPRKGSQIGGFRNVEELVIESTEGA